MTIDEAIKHCEEKAKELRCEAQSHISFSDRIDCYECAKEHEQLAGWLKELKVYQELFTSPEEAEKLLEQFMV